MEQVEGYGEEEAEGEREDDPLVEGSGGEHVRGEGAEGDGLVRTGLEWEEGGEREREGQLTFELND